MPLNNRTVLAAAASMLAAALPAAANAQSTGLEDMIGARAGQAEAAIQSRGYRLVRGEKGDDRSYTYWWNADRRQCVTIATMDGRYNSITPTLAPDCRQPASIQPRAEHGREADHRSDRGYAPQPGYSDRAYPPGGRDSGPMNDGPIVDGRPVSLALVCFGDGSRDGVATGRDWTWNDKHQRYEREYYNESTTEQFDATLTVQLWDGGGRIRLPRSLIPPLNSRGSDGWWDLYDVAVGPDMIRATYRLNGLNKPRLTIDRRSGRIEVQGFSQYGFRGRCDQIGNQPRRF